ncbi:hypothetical protein SLEP1_g10547 [Rubroshorea leprosula]|uniref:NB-ARC domain-containing protein n=1 Tax=Rubroshorea leprosula TaxID=152421 RepID=A0AAV5I8G0_9ROSI|nr:hypothetical protein SLEP1_g10547 [Rubroshorea leprosula]
MVGSCAGLPLAIVVLGGLLATKETLSEWDMVNRNIRSYLSRTKGHEQARLSEVLALSYHELPYQSKPCFLYLSQFPEDFDIPTKKLVQQWVAEGFVFSQDEIEGDETVEDVAEGYLHSLINRCMVQVGVRGSIGTIKTCRLHDLMRDLCLLKARQESFMDIINHWRGSETLGAFSSSSEIRSIRRSRRLSILLREDVDDLILPQYKKNPNLRSLFFFRSKKHRLDIAKIMNSAVAKFKLLKVLDLEGIKGPKVKLPAGIGTMTQLRFLRIKKTLIRELPSSLVNLVLLETLNLQTINKHLYLPKWCGDVTDKLQLANLIKLQTLVNFPANKCDVKDLLSLTNLRKLVLNDARYFGNFVKIFDPPRNTLNFLMSLSLKTDILSFPDKVVDLRQLLLGCPHLCKLHIEGRIENLPEYHEFPPYLAKLTLWGSRLQGDPMKTLEKLPNLRYFSGWEVFVGKKMVRSREGFPQLKTLLLRGLPNLEEWTVEEGAMHSLARLGISDCYKLKIVPEGMMFITTLKELEIRWMTRAFKSLLQEDGEDFYKIQHVPSIVFLN